jgi:glycosyltransferase involved in cell wall biosynthesis
MRILYVMHRFHTNQFFAMKALVDRGHEVHIFVQRHGRPEDHSIVVPQIIPPSRLNRLYMPFLKRREPNKARDKYELPSIMAMIREMRRLDPDIVVVRQMKVHSILASLVAALQRRRRVVLEMRPVAKLRESWHRQVFKALGIQPKRRYSTISGVAGADKPLAANGVHHIALPIEPPAAVPPERPLDPECIRLICVAQFSSQRKRHELLLAAFAQLCQTYPITLTLAGNAGGDRKRMQALQATCEAEGLSDRVTFLCDLPYEEMLRTYLDHDVFVLPARNEPYGMAVLEAMAYGMPVICSDTCGARDCLETGVNGEIFRTDDGESLRCAIELIITDRERLRRMGQESLRIVRQRHSPETFHDRLLGLALGDEQGGWDHAEDIVTGSP